MKFIRKGREPAVLQKFKRTNAGTPNAGDYASLDGRVKQALTTQMLKEQGGLCAYTMRRIGRETGFGFHIEHVQPRSRRPELQLDYGNMILCAPGEEQRRCEWGAKQKGDSPVDEDFVSPLRADCETRLIFRADGSVRFADEGAKATIKILNLNHRELVAERRQALQAFGLGPDARKPLGGAEARRLSRQIDLADAKGDYPPYCVAIRQVASKVAEQAKRRAARLRQKT